ncbi:hypothetical protein FHW58_004614 [Duganella sp. 1224]|uniref:CPBP family glutamic-type intramembrane protease n=1 Tax=Duganella sp. 1224 TaxID=2587052 RepID=UPI0015CC7943|nr:CPBP family glutamic-type intramembrane protease [Duganella sp. 1224]NYE63384.1 hypothetical protein [Duganella sp. 1224]
MQLYHLILSRRWPLSLIESRPYRSALLLGAGTGLLSASLGATVACLLQALLPRQILGPSAAAALANLAPWSLLVMGGFLIPLWETCAAQWLPLEMGRLAGFNDIACVALAAMVFGAGHYLNGGLAHGVCAAIAGALFATAYLVMRPCGYLPAFWASFVAHAVNNLLLLLILLI